MTTSGWFYKIDIKCDVSDVDGFRERFDGFTLLHLTFKQTTSDVCLKLSFFHPIWFQLNWATFKKEITTVIKRNGHDKSIQLRDDEWHS